jgi:hypothetical protein
MQGIKSVHLATVKLCTSCSQKAERTAPSLKSDVITFLLGGKNIFLTSFNGLYLLKQLTD